MPTALLQTKLYIHPVQPELVSRPRLIERVSAGVSHEFSLISAPAGFGKTTLFIVHPLNSCACVHVQS